MEEQKDTNQPLLDPEKFGQVQQAVTGQPVPQQAVKEAAKPDAGGFFWGTGRRKSSVARVRIRPGQAKLIVNKKEVDKYFKKPQDLSAVKSPLNALNVADNFEVHINVNGGGTTGQAGASLLGIARALAAYDPNLVKPLREGGYLTRDGRMVERKKPGKAGARRSFQFSKR